MLLDTHAVVWLLAAPERLGRGARRVIGDGAGGNLALAAISLYEMAALARKGSFTGEGVREMMEAAEQRFEVLPITAAICVATLTLPARFPRDPADRMIAATAVVHGATLVTADGAIRRAGAVATIW
jgi:PIN domain nuclease of toxin-antitoxin system